MKRNLNLVISGWLLLVSGVWQVGTLTSPVPLFGAMRGGVTAALYNAALGGAFSALGYALVKQLAMTRTALWVASVVYTFDKVSFMVDAEARRAAIAGSREILLALGGGLEAQLDQLMVLMSGLFLCGWWGLVVYVYLKTAAPARSELSP